ncbi:MAG: DUF362 domain-containing protein [Ardenticatenaceae bacterium]|nr:DUF362 domain-containing protein [Ardenticatenaceae bacterium]HBY98253.1 iron-sulfur cluster-binding protein [Chloroflexota bacterium]
MIDAQRFPGRGQVAILRTAPATVLDDYHRLMNLAGYQQNLPKDHETILKINISWQLWYPGCSTPPWQLEGVTKTLLRDGYGKESLIAAHNRTVVVSAKEGEVNNRHKAVVDKYALRNVHIYEPEIEWVRYEPKRKFLVLDAIYPEGVHIPRFFYNRNIIHLPQTKTHVFTTMTGAMKNAFGGLLNERRHWTHAVIHETLVDLLQIQQDIHSGLFAVMDGTLAGDGPGPRAMRPHVKNVILASADQVALDATAARIMGFDPMSIKFLRLAHERGLGVADPRAIKIVGDEATARENWHFRGNENTFASRGQKFIYHGPLKPLEPMLLRSPLTPWSYIASNLYHNTFWYPFVGYPRVQHILNNTDWGALLRTYGDAPINSGYSSKLPFAGLMVTGAMMLAGTLWALNLPRRL